MNKPYPTRVVVALLLVLGFAVVSDLRWLAGVARALAVEPGSDEVSRSDARLDPLRLALPPRAVVGYVAPPPPVPRSAADSARYSSLSFRRDLFKHYVLLQYALAPTIVSMPPGPDTLVADFGSAAAAAGLAESLRVLQDFGNGLLLLQRRDR